MRLNALIGALVIAGLFISTTSFRNSDTSFRIENDKPKIIIGMMVDQMRWDYLYKYRDRYSEGGFKRLLREGFTCENTLIRHAPTVTACGHASVYTGSVPAINGIAGNSWFDRDEGKDVSNVGDNSVQLTGASGDGRSPRNLLTTTIGDELRIATNYKSKVVGVAIKDRAAILPAGHTANGAFWYEGGKFITSSYYMRSLPPWVQKFNQVNWQDSLMPDGWNTLYPINSYILSEEDNKSYEEKFSGESGPVFPHKKASITTSPFGNRLTLEFAKAAIEGYHLGKSEYTDLLAVSLSSPDMIGHRFGPNSIEIEDNYLRLDKQLEQFFNYLDKRFGRKGYLFFITADHGVNHSPGYLKERRIPTGVLNNDALKNVNLALMEKYGTSNIISSLTNGQIYLNKDVLIKNRLDKISVATFIAEQLKQEPGIENAFPSESLGTANLPERIKTMFINGTHAKRSGDIIIIRSAGWKGGSWKGASHGDWNPYDAHIPLVWMGWGITPGATHRTTGMTDIAPTLAAMLKIQMPSGNIGEVIREITD